MGDVVRLARQPLFLQVYDLLRERIARGVWKPGGMLPNEQDLARELGVSSGTIRKALDELEARRLVTRRQGRGTFVTDHTKGEMVFRFNNIREMGNARIGGDAQLIAQATGQADHIEQERLRLHAGDVVLRTQRARRNQGRPFMHEETCLAISRFTGCETGVGGDYDISALAQEYGVHLMGATEKVRVAEASAEIAVHLAVAPGKPLLMCERIIFAMDHRPVEWRVGSCDLKDEYYLAEFN